MRTDWILVLLGLLLILAGSFLDSLGVGGAPGFGVAQWLMVGLGIGAAVMGIVRGRWRRTYARLVVAGASAYLALLVFEIFTALLLAPARATKSPAWSMRGYVQPAAWGGYELTPSWRGRHEDGILTIDIAINALGDRDSLPHEHEESARRVLLVGDSFAFGWGLKSADTIDGQIEALSSNKVTSYSLGVPGYGPEDTLEHYRERTAWSPTHTVYLMCGNDLRQDNSNKEIHTACEGIIVSRAGPDGTPFSRAQWQAEILKAKQHNAAPWQLRLKECVALRQLRKRVASIVDVDLLLAEGFPRDYNAAALEAALRNTTSMQALARDRGQSFAVLVIPILAETNHKRYFAPVKAYVDELVRRSVPVIEVRDLLGSNDFLAHDGHLAASGAAIVARAIVAFANQ